MNETLKEALRPIYGTAGRIGLIVPANNSVIEPELWSVLPPDTAVYSTRVRAKGDLTPDAVRLMEEDVEAAVEAIASTGVDVIAYCDMVTTFIMEAGWNEAAVEGFQTKTGIPVISAWTALRDALSKLKIRKFALGTPYPRTIHENSIPFFRERGFEIAAHATLDIVAMREVPTVGKDRLWSLVKTIYRPECDAVVLLATDLPSFPYLQEMEREIGVPILTSNQTILWRALSILGQRPIKELGRLFQH